MHRYRLHVEAERDLLGGAAYYNAHRPGLGRLFVLEVRRTCETVAQFPESGSRMSATLRRRLVRRFPFAVYYSFIDGEVLILAVAHQARLPGYWHGRS